MSNRENPQNSEPQNGPRRGLDFIALYNMYDGNLQMSEPSNKNFKVTTKIAALLAINNCNID